MLGVQRPAVTVAVQALERKGLIEAGRRGNNRFGQKEALIRFSKGAYVPPS